MKHNEKWLLLCCQVLIVKLPQTQLPKDGNQTRKKNTKQKHTVNYLLRANAHSGNWLFQALEPILGFLKLNLSSFEQPLENQPNIKYNSNYEINLILKISFSKKQNNSHLKIFGFFQESLISKGKEKCVISCSKGNYLQKWIDKNKQGNQIQPGKHSYWFFDKALYDTCFFDPLNFRLCRNPFTTKWIAFVLM